MHKQQHPRVRPTVPHGTHRRNQNIHEALRAFVQVDFDFISPAALQSDSMASFDLSPQFALLKKLKHQVYPTVQAAIKAIKEESLRESTSRTPRRSDSLKEDLGSPNLTKANKY